MPEMPEFIVIKNKKFVLTSVKATHREHTTYIATWSNRTYLVRTYNYGYEKALADYKELKHAGINMAKMCFHDDENHVIVFDYFPEDDCLEDLSKGPLPEKYFEALFSLYRFARFSKVALDWEPQNFMLRGTQMFYLPTKWSRLTEENKFEKEGLFTWFWGKDGVSLLKRKGFNVEGKTVLSDAEVNKAAAMMAIRYW